MEAVKEKLGTHRSFHHLRIMPRNVFEASLSWMWRGEGSMAILKLYAYMLLCYLVACKARYVIGILSLQSVNLGWYTRQCRGVRETKERKKVKSKDTSC